MKRVLKIIAAIVIILAIPAIIQKVMFGGEPDREKAALARLADETNATLPRKIDPETTLTRVEFDRDVWRVSYTLAPSAEIDPYSQQIYKKRAIKEICGSNMQKILLKKITIEFLYTYTDAAGEQKLRISIPPGSC